MKESERASMLEAIRLAVNQSLAYRGYTEHLRSIEISWIGIPMFSFQGKRIDDRALPNVKVEFFQ